MSDQSIKNKMEFVWDAGDVAQKWATNLQYEGFISYENVPEILERLAVDLLMRAHVVRRELDVYELVPEEKRKEQIMLAENIRNIADSVEREVDFYQ
jgi:hypothetical protein